ncbi:hypothetical protein [Streptomyces ficellus]|uniref:Uncharacterized protein n=1 Tax=Streptomyces ficellus TaxID=1977088 RepID=A0A6I6F2I7_9ACTN|nr:hypothetical protein [Streptomyces ficellus]QGV76981.1 hypothetical protein EIZ62_00960 [Streptomyces ficellus]
MDDKRLEGAGESGPGVPRDMPDKQAGDGPDHWDPDLSEATDGEEQDQTRAEDAPDDGVTGEPSG